MEEQKNRMKLIFNTGFVLYGYVEKETDAGVWFVTDQKRSFINFNDIKRLQEVF